MRRPDAYLHKEDTDLNFFGNYFASNNIYNPRDLKYRARHSWFSEVHFHTDHSNMTKVPSLKAGHLAR